MLRAFRNLFGGETKPSKYKSRRPVTRRRLGMEGLETRELMAGFVGTPTLDAEFVPPPAPSAVTVSIQNNDLYIRGTDGPDKVQVSAPVNGKWVVKISTEHNGKAQTQTSYWRVYGGDVFFYGNGGDDHFVANNKVTLRVSAYGGPGNDYMVGSDGNDNLNGGDGHDEVRGGRGNDTLNGDAGDDRMYGFDGNDRMYGGTGYDRIFGELGDDTISTGADYSPSYVDGGGGNDTIEGGYGIDELFGGLGNDTISGNDGNDFIRGNDGNDYLYGGYGHDDVEGAAGNDFLSGSHGEDYLKGGKGNDKLYGGDDNDVLDGGMDNQVDELYGEDGKDKFRRDPDDPNPYQSTDFDLPEDPEPGEEKYF